MVSPAHKYGVQMPVALIVLQLVVPAIQSILQALIQSGVIHPAVQVHVDTAQQHIEDAKAELAKHVP